MKINTHWLAAMLILFSSFFFSCYAKDGDESEKKEPPKLGNLTLSGSQQPGPFVSLGQNIIGKDVWQIYLYGDDLFSPGKHNIDVLPYVIYGVTDNFSINFNLPIAANYKQGAAHSSGLEDMSLQFEYAFYNKSSHEFIDQATIVGNIAFPTGSSHKQPPTGFGAPSFLVLGTYNRTTVDWVFFASPGVILTTAHQGLKFGDQYLYQGGIAKNICYTPKKRIFTAMLEIDGQYNEKTKIKGIDDPNSGGNVIYLTPSLWLSTQKWIFQVGAGWVVSQHFFGYQPDQKYLVAADVAWTF